MSIGILEIERAHRALEEYCRARNAAAETASSLRCLRNGGELVLAESARSTDAEPAGGPTPLVRLEYRDGKWLLFWRAPRGAWLPYPQLPESDSIRRIIEELEQAPLHVHWG